jgi:hypothetical protein
MKSVSDTFHLQRRGGTWHYYRRTPSNLVSVIGRRFFKRSLKTSSLAGAKKLRTVEDPKLDALFTAVAEKKFSLNGSANGLRSCVSLDTMIDYVRKHVSDADQRAAKSTH